MFFYAYIQPEVFSEANADGEDARQSMITILKDFRENCFLAVFQDWRWSENVKDHLKEWPPDMKRKKVKKILENLKKNSRYLDRPTPDYLGLTADIDIVLTQASTVPLDITLVTREDIKNSTVSSGELVTRTDYGTSGFEALRSNVAAYGVLCQEGEKGVPEFMEHHFARALKYANEVHICDRICGNKNMADNFQYTIKEFLRWLGTLIEDPAAMKLLFHIGNPRNPTTGQDHIKQSLKRYRDQFLSGATVEIRFYDENSGSSLPHWRSLMTESAALEIDRGMDFLDKKTAACRETSINLKSKAELESSLSNHSADVVNTFVL